MSVADRPRRRLLGKVAQTLMLTASGLRTTASGLGMTASGALALAAAGTADAHDSVGPVIPATPAPRVAMITDGGDRTSLSALLQGSVTAVQLMFAGCSAICPIQGALFAQLQGELDALPPGSSAASTRLLSISIDPRSDDSAALRAWLARFGAGARWSAASPDPDELDRLLAFLKGRVAATEPHTAQVALFDGSGRFVWRTAELPTANTVVRLAEGIARG
jgi:protein SCO1/2